MRRSKFAESLIAFVVKQAEECTPIAEVGPQRGDVLQPAAHSITMC